MKTIIAYIVGYESCPVNGGASGFEWYTNESIADQDYFDTLKMFMNSSQEVYQGELEIEVSEDYSGTLDEREGLTERVETFLEENDWNNAFKKKEGCFKAIRHKLTL